MSHILPPILIALCATALVGCGGGGSNSPPIEGVPVVVEGFSTYRTDHNNRNRVRRDQTVEGSTEQINLAAFDKGKGPASYKDLVAINTAQMTIEVVAEVAETGKGMTTQRVLRLTADQIPLENTRNGQLIAATGKYYFRGQSFAWVTIDNGPVLTGKHANGLENMMIDFGTGQASLVLRTEINAATGSEVEITFDAQNLPFNVVSGAFGGAVSIEVKNPSVTESYQVDGVLRGSVGGKPVYSNGQHGLSTSGVFTAKTPDGATIPVTVDGVFLGADPNLKP